MSRRQRKLFRKQAVAEPQKFKAPGDSKLICPVIVDGYVPEPMSGDRFPRRRECGKKARRFKINGFGVVMCNSHANRAAKKGNIVAVDREKTDDVHAGSVRRMFDGQWEITSPGDALYSAALMTAEEVYSVDGWEKFADDKGEEL